MTIHAPVPFGVRDAADAAAPRRRGPANAADRVIRQVRAIESFTAARRDRERALLTGPLTRDQRMDVDRELDALRRTHDTIRGRCAAGLADGLDPFRSGTTAVIAHRHAWFSEKVAASLVGCGVTVLLCTDNGAEAIGAVVADQPDLLLVGERLAMRSGPAVLAEAVACAPATLRGLHVGGQERPDLARGADAVFPRHYPPGVVADALLALHLTPQQAAAAQ